MAVRIRWQKGPQRWSNTDTVVEGPGFCGRSTFSGGVERFLRGITRLQSVTTRFEWWEHVRPQRGATHKTLIINDLLDFRVVIFTTLKSVKSLSVRQLRDASGVYGNKKPLNSFALTSEGLAGIIRCRAGVGGQGKPLRRWKARRP